MGGGDQNVLKNENRKLFLKNRTHERDLAVPFFFFHCMEFTEICYSDLSALAALLLFVASALILCPGALASFGVLTLIIS